MILNCAVCNQPYETIFPNKKYCSDICAKRGRINKRKQWEKDTNYNEKQRLDKLVKRQQEKEVRTAEETERLRLKKEKNDQSHAERIENKKVELKERAKNGNPAARMELAKPNSKEYWEAYQQYEIDYYNKWNTKAISVINEISVFDDDFVEKVLKSIEVEGRIYGRLISEKRK